MVHVNKEAKALTKQFYIDLGRQVDGWRLKEVN